MKRNTFHVVPESSDDVSTIRPSLSSSFERALATMWLAFQPIVRASDRSVLGYESLLRTDEPSLPGPVHVLEAAEKLGELQRLGRSVRELAAAPFARNPDCALLFVNLHPRDLMDPEFCSAASALSSLASRVVLEITERASLGKVENLRGRVAHLREMGYRIAVDDLGAGYAGLTSFALLEPEIVKLDMSLVRDVDASPVKQKLVASMLALAQDMGLMLVAEGVETEAERDTLLGLGCDLFQGYLFARPERSFPEPSWGELPVKDRGSETPASGTHRIAARSAPCDTGEDVSGASVVFGDVTALRKAEQELERANAELRAVQAREAELSAFLVHDLKSPLTAILASVLVLLDGRHASGEECEYLRDIRDSALSMHRMVLDLLDVHTAEDGALAVKFQPVDIGELVELVRAEMAPRAAHRRQRIEVPHTLAPTVLEIDRELFRRVMQNLIDNCIKYGPAGGRIELDARLSDRESLVVSVRDEGAGVPDALRERVFEKYARLERDVTGRGCDSRGLGLRFCQVAVEAHGGRIWVEDNVPKGACFSIELPLVRPSKPRK